MTKVKINATTIIPSPTWGRTLQLFQEKGHVYLVKADSKHFRGILNAAKLPFRVRYTIKGTLKLHKFVSLEPKTQQQ